MTQSSAGFWDEVRRSNLLPRDRLASLAAQFQGWYSSQNPKSAAEAQRLTPARWLVSQKHLTAFQAEVIENGLAERLSYASYQLIGPRSSGLDDLSTPCAVFRAVHPESRHRLELFFVAGDHASSQNSWELHAQIANLWKPLECKHLHRVWDVLSLKQHRLIVADPFDGMPYSQKVPAGKRLPAHRALRHFEQMLKVVRELHELQMTHGRLDFDAFYLDRNEAPRLLPPFLAGRISAEQQPADAADEESDKHSPEADDLPTAATANSSEPSTAPARSEPKPWGSSAYLAPEAVTSPNLADEASDVFSLGLILHRLLVGQLPAVPSGSAPKSDGSSIFRIASAEKVGYPQPLSPLMQQMTAGDPTQRPSLEAVQATLAKISVDDPKSVRNKPFSEPHVSPTSAEFQKWLSRWQPPGNTNGEADNLAGLQLATQAAEDVAGPAANQAIATEGGHRLAGRQRSRSGNRNLLMTSVLTATVLALVTAFTYIGIQIGRSMSPVQVVADGSDTDQPSDSDSPGGSGTEPAPQGNGDPQGTRPANRQNIVDDNGNLPWESPTWGPPLDLSLVPPSPRLVVSIRIADLLAAAEGPRILQSLGADTQGWVAGLPAWTGFAAEEIESLIVSWHSNSQEYEFAAKIRLIEPLSPMELADRWPTSEPVMTSSGISFAMREDELSYYYRRDDETDVPGDSSSRRQKIQEFVVGPRKVLMPVIESRGLTRLDGTMGQLAANTDSSRLFNLFMVRSALSCEEGQRVIAPPWDRLNRGLTIRMDDRLQGLVLSAHLDNGLYIESRFQNSVDVKPGAFRDTLLGQLAGIRDVSDQALSSFRADPYWERVRIRLDDMISMLVRNFRVGVENGQVIANCWLPEVAGHNLIAGAELALLTTSDDFTTMPRPGSSPAGQPNPTNLQQLLETRRNLFEANPPDLNVLLSEFQSAVRSDFPQLPFEFEIVLIGADLEAAGITRNQRPSQLDLQDQTVSQILTQVMFLANPEKNATGPADELCKLVWVIGPHPDKPQQQAILVTTREAVAAKGLELPPAFRSGN